MWLAAGVAGLVGAALCLWLMHERSMPGLRALDKNFQCPDMRFRYSPEELFGGLDRLAQPVQDHVGQLVGHVQPEALRAQGRCWL